MRNINFRYYYGNQAEQFSFFRIPKLLFTDKAFNTLSSDAKVLYGILLDRMSLSMKNDWLDEENRVYIIFTIEEIAEIFGCGTQKATKILQELDTTKGIGLVEKKRLGLGKPSILYVKNFVIETQEDISKEEKTYEDATITPEEKHDDEITKQDIPKSQKQNCENHNSRKVNFTNQELLKSQSNKTNINNTDINNTDILKKQSINHSKYSNTKDNEEYKEDRLIEKQYRKLIKENIEYDILKCSTKLDVNLLDEILELMTEVVTSKKKEIKINQEQIPQEAVKSRFLKITSEHIKYIIESLSQNTKKVSNIRGYLISTIYNSYTTMNNYYTSNFNNYFYET